MNTKEEYEMYRFNCHCQGDIWNETHYPYSYKEWLVLGCPENGGHKIKTSIFENKSKFS